MIQITAVKLHFKSIQIRNFIFFLIKNACQDTVDLIVQLNVLIHYTDTDVKDFVTVAITRVMYQQDVEQSHQVFYNSERYSVEIFLKKMLTHLFI